MANSLQQNTIEWHQVRRTHIGSSDAPIVMGVGRKTPYRLWLEKLGHAKNETNSAMERGKAMESTALAAYCDRKGIKMTPSVRFSTENLWQMASLDGLSECGNYAVELKMAGAEDHAIALDGKVPVKYWPQVQHQMCVLGLDQMDYHSVPWHSEDCTNGVTVTCHRDMNYILEMVPKCEEFWEMVMEQRAPELTERDIVERNDNAFISIAAQAAELLRERKAIEGGRLAQIEKELATLKKQAVELAGDESCIGGGIRLRRSQRMGSLDSDLLGREVADLSKYRKPASWIWTMTLESE